MTRFALTLFAVMLLPAALPGCELLGIEPATALAARKEAEGKAIGGACRHAGRAIEDCYALNKRVEKAAVFAGWREMNDYMRDNKIDTVPPAQSVPGKLTTAAADEDDSGEEPGAKAGKAGAGAKPSRAAGAAKAGAKH
jgi:hypothetical protein